MLLSLIKGSISVTHSDLFARRQPASQSASQNQTIVENKNPWFSSCVSIADRSQINRGDDLIIPFNALED